MYLKQAIKLIVDTYKIQLETGKRFAIELVGPPGLGKTEGVQQAAEILAAHLGQPFANLPFFLSTVEPCDVRGFGLPGKDADGSLIMQYTRAPWAPKVGDPKHGFIFLDEFGQAADDVAKPSAELLLHGRVGATQLPIEYMVLAASNREKDRSGVRRKLAFIENRRMMINIEPHLDSWVEWAELRGIDPFAIAFAKVHPGVVFTDAVPDKSGPYCTPRTFVQTSYLIGKLDMSAFTEAASGYIGEGAAAQFVSFLRVAEQIPDFDDIVANPDKVPVPERMDAQYAVMQMLAHRVSELTSIAVFRYLKRMGKEFQVAGLKSGLRRCPNMVNTPDFHEWLRNNKDLVMAANVLDVRR